MCCLRRPLALLLLLGAAACGDDPFEVRWTENPDSVLLYSLDRPEINLPSAFNFVARSTVQIQLAGASGRWDLAVDTRDGALVFLPPGAAGVSSTARIARLEGMGFEEVLEAPSDSLAYVSEAPVPVTTGTVYVVRTHREVASFGRRCVYYAKLEPFAADPEQGTVRFVFDSNPVCNNRRLVPPED